MPTVNDAELAALATAIYQAAGTPEEHARVVVAHQVGANLAGHDSHGVIRILHYLEMCEEGEVFPAAEPET